MQAKLLKVLQNSRLCKNLLVKITIRKKFEYDKDLNVAYVIINMSYEGMVFALITA